MNGIRISGLVIALLAALFVFLLGSSKVDRIDYLSDTASWSVELPEEDLNSVSGYENGQRRLIVPGHHNPSFAWIMETQIALAEGKVRLREVAYDNAPHGRETHRTAPYRWYLSTLASIVAVASDQATGASVETAARWSDPLLQIVMIIGLALFVSRRFGVLSAAVSALCLVGLFPLSANFVPGAPDAQSLMWVFAAGAVFPLLASSRKSDFVISGLSLGICLWTEPVRGLPILVCVALGIWASVLWEGKNGKGTVIAYWRQWGIAAASVCFSAYFLEYFPGHLTWKIESIHVWHALLLWGIGELANQLWRMGNACGEERPSRSRIYVGLSLFGIALFPFMAWGLGNGVHFASSPYVQELANHPEGTYAANLLQWIARDGFSLAVWAVFLPSIVLAVSLIWLFVKTECEQEKRCLVFVFATGTAAAFFSCFYLSFWNVFNLLILAGVVLAFGGKTVLALSGAARTVLVSVLLITLLPGLSLSGKMDRDPERDLDPIEVQTMVERDLAYWLKLQAGEESPVVFSTPGVMESLSFYGGLRGIGSYAWENKSGLEASARIASASSGDEASILLTGREATHVVLPSWDASVDDLIRRGRSLGPEEALPSNTLVASIRSWDLPPWMWPVPYLIPNETGFGDLSVVAFRMGSEQEPVYALSRLGDYFLELGLARHALWVWDKLSLYPRDVSALSTQAQISLKSGDQNMFRQKVEELTPFLSRRGIRLLPTDRRISLTTTLVQARKIPEAKEQFEWVVAALDANRLEELSASNIVRLFAMSKILDVPLEDTELRNALLARIPPTMRERLPSTSP